MDINEIKKKFRHKNRADIKDLELALDAVPFLVREIEKLESDLRQSHEMLEDLKSKLKKQPPLAKQGRKNKTTWKVKVDEKKNRLFIKLSGKLDYNSAKAASNNIIPVFSNLRKNFDVINDISNVDEAYDKKAVFHLRKIMYNLKRLGVRRLVKIINPKIPELSDVFEDKSKKPTVTVFLVNSIAEGEAKLDNINKFLQA